MAGIGWVEVRSPGWRFRPVRVAIDPVTRWRGLRGGDGGIGLLLWTRAVHGRGLHAPVEVVTLDRRGTVTGTDRLLPGGALWLPGAAWVLELPEGTPLPGRAATLTIGAIAAPS